MHRFEDTRQPAPIIAGRAYRPGDAIEGAALELALRFGFKVAEELGARALEELPEALDALEDAADEARDWATATYAEILEAAQARGYEGTSRAKTALLAFLRGKHGD